jgi:hypothetical protein
MNYNLLSSLRKYRPREGKDSLENYITEAFGWILNSFKDFSNYFTNILIEKLEIKRSEIDEVNWITQANFGGVFPDMLCTFGDFAIVIENKVWRRLDEGQIERYRDYAKKHFSESKIILITASTNQWDQNPDLALCWSDIYKWITGWIERQSEDPDHIFLSFLDLLTVEGLGAPAPISHESILCYYPSRFLKDRVSSLLQIVYKKDWQSLIPSLKLNLYAENKRGKYFGEEWGRFGIDLLGPYEDARPGIFVGFMVDGEDHRVKPLLEERSPDYSVILSFHSDLHGVYRRNPFYRGFVDRVGKIVGGIGDHWDFYNHIEDQSVSNPNVYHPIHIRKPMLELFRGTKTMDEQVERFMTNTKKMLDIMFEKDEILRMQEEFKKIKR